MGDVFEILAIGVSTTLFFGVVLGFIALMRWMRYKETIEMAKRGLVHPRHEARGGRRMSRGRRWGTLITAFGIAMTCGLATIGLDSHNPLLGPWLLGGLIPLSFGASLLYMSSRNEERVMIDHQAEPLQIEDDPIPPHKM